MTQIKLSFSRTILNYSFHRKFEGNTDVFLVAATLRPETMYGQTNCWVHPEINYVAYKLKSGEVCVSTRRAARNMSFQKLTCENGKFHVETELVGTEIMGVKLSAPLTQHEVRTFYLLSFY